jgi:glyoxylase I family protein
MPNGTSNRQIPGCGTHHIALQTRDWEASLRLYRDVLGMQVVAEFGTPERRILLLDIGDGSHMELFAPLPGAADQPAANLLTHIALATTDTRQATEQVRQAGYTIKTEPKDVQLGPIAATIAFFIGPNGETIEFFQTN